MDSGDALQITALILLILLSAFFSSAETAMTTLNKIRIQTLAEQGSRRARILQKIIADPPRMLSTVLIGNNIVNIFASSLMTMITLRLLGNAFVSIGTGLLTLVILIFGEITPKTMATIHAERLSLAYARVIYALMILFTPLVFLVQNLSFLLLKLLRVDPNARGAAITEHELRTLVNVSQEDGIIRADEKKMIYNVFDFGDSVAKDVMVPRIDVTFIDVNSTHEEFVKIYREMQHTRYPVYEDNTDNIVGIINIKDLLLLSPREKFSIRGLLREPYFTYEHKPTADLLLEMRESSFNLAIVLDEYGSTAGLVTTEDLIEEIVGEIRDEYDEEEKEDITALIPGREYVILGSAKLDDVNEALDLQLESEDYDSIGGYIIEQLDSLPIQGQSLTLESGVRLVADVVRRKRIELVHLYLP